MVVSLYLLCLAEKWKKLAEFMRTELSVSGQFLQKLQNQVDNRHCVVFLA